MLPSETSRDAIRLLVEEKVLSAVRRCLGVGSDARKRVEAMDALVDVTTQLPLRSIELWERRIRAEVWDFERKQPKSRWMFLKPPPRVPGWLDIAHGDGFKRERTLRTLNAGAPIGFFFVLALRRLNDWVPQVRAAAREQLPRISDHTDVTYVVDALWATLPRFSQWGRVAAEALIRNPQAAGSYAQQLAARLAGDSHASVAERGRFVLTQFGNI